MHNSHNHAGCHNCKYVTAMTIYYPVDFNFQHRFVQMCLNYEAHVEGVYPNKGNHMPRQVLTIIILSKRNFKR